MFEKLTLINVRQFKDKISGSIGISADAQRLIFQGKVMQDEKILKDYDIHGKVIHLVQRAPPATITGSSHTNTASSSSSTASNPPGRPLGPIDGNLFDVQIHLGRVNQLTPNNREARARIRQADFNLGLISDLLNLLEQRSASNATHGDESVAGSFENMDTSSPDTGRQEPESSTTQQPRSTETNGEGVFMATDLAEFLDRLLNINERIVPQIRRYRDLLRREENYAESTNEAHNAQEVVNTLSEALHAMSHVFHSISDVTVDMSANVPRQGMATPPAPFHIPGTTSMAIPIHMNVRARQNGNGNRQRQGQQETPSTAATGASPNINTHTTFSGQAPTINLSSVRNNAADNNNFSIPSVTVPLPGNLASTGDSAMMVEVYPTGVTVHDIRAVVTQEVVDAQNPSSDASSGPSNITVVSAATIDPVVVTATPNPAQVSAASTPSSAVPPPPPPSTPRTTDNAGFTTSTTASSTSTFTFSPTTSVNIAGVPSGIGIAQMPNLPGLPTGMLQNILGSILNSHGVRPGQPVQVNVHQMTTPGSFGARLNGRSPRPQQASEIPLDGDLNSGEGSSNLRNQPTADASLQTSATFVESQTPSLSDASTNTSQQTVTVSSTGNSSTNATVTFAVNGNRDGGVSRADQGSNTRLTTGLHQNIQRPGRILTRGPSTLPTTQGHQPSVIMRPPGPNPFAARGYVDPYLPCASNFYTSELARNAFRNIQIQMQSRGQQPSQQVPNLSTMVSGMVGEIIEQVGQAAQQAMNSSNRANAPAPSTTSSANTTSASNQGEPSSTSNRIPIFNPLDIFSTMMNPEMAGGQMRQMPFDIRAVLGNLMNPGAPADSSTLAPPGTLAHLFTSIRSANGDGADESNVILGLIEAIAPHMRLTDLFQLVTGDTQVLSRLRTPLRDFVRSKITQHGSIERVVEITLDDMSTEINFMQGLVEVRSGVDMAASVRNCLKFHLTNLFTTVNSDIRDEEFGQQLYSLWMRMMAETIGLCVYCIRDGQVGFSNMVQRYMPRMTQEMNPHITLWMTTSLREILGTFYHNHPIQETDIIRYVVQTSQRSVEIERIGMSTAKTASSSDSSVNRQSTPSKMEVNSSPSPQPPRAKVPRTAAGDEEENSEIFLDAQESLGGSATPKSRPTNFTSRSQTPSGTLGNARTVRNGKSSDDWQSVIPQQWIPVISQDIVRQQEQRPQPPLSDAYLQGLPAKRRRMMTLEHAAEMANMSQYFPASIARAARAAGAEPISSEDNLIHEATMNHELQAELEREVASVLETRLSADTDFNSERFPNTKEYFHKSKRH
ncbi:hypothetical protein Btru_072699 [Bulinus truncatus]|nr:hypothetical protein Btru_072699 [Bulinus truncatus]